MKPRKRKAPKVPLVRAPNFGPIEVHTPYTGELMRLCEKWPATGGTAIHEAGHAVAGMCLGRIVRLISVYEGLGELYSGSTCLLPSPEWCPDSRLAEMVILAAGGEAARSYGLPAGNEKDLEMMGSEARRLHGLLESEPVIEREIAIAHQRAEKLIGENRAHVERVAVLLLRFYEAQVQAPFYNVTGIW